MHKLQDGVIFHGKIHYSLKLVHCEWNAWYIGACSKTCGDGVRVLTRTKKHQSRYGGHDCYGPSSWKENCMLQECPGSLDYYMIFY